ncbi:molecular chaperone HtpG [Gordonia sp. (in: high G+C Gram-positive bacteria)]|uniref:molecular chaperone HtpG n=1 Tax=Gordonia sp. (in: high G+C Gram-positive bacteria) TaxID=84139 RepID=UPI0016914772|nr:molecular chaperone HtpG [Gordonia sp. (in: high G+C Gram-positive bacteria)]NLG46337.1 molecular chaperone HtpG [Gordonia sp. (in: high G+C Gram-positive bacteria)]
MTSQVFQFQAQARQLLDLMVHSIYSNKDSFLRELVSNASDAVDKLRLEGLRDKDLDADISDLHIRLTPDAQARTLTVADNGIGMSREEVIDLIGTVAKSGTDELRQTLAASDPADAGDLIGQFGIGFYSVFMVAERVELVTRKAGETVGTRWESTGDGTYTLDEVADAPQGTTITLSLKPVDEDDAVNDYADPNVLRGLVKKYSDFISWPIRMSVTKHTPGEELEDGTTAEPTVEEVDETLNSQKALWAKSPSEVSKEEYAEFYRHVSHAWDDPLETITLHAEGTFEYQALLFIPTQAPFDLFMRERANGIHLYVKRVFIMDDAAELMPEYLRFVQGVVDAADLSLNVSREILQQDRQIRAIRRRLVKKVIASVQEIQDRRPEDYQTFWSNFGRVFKEGLINDQDNAKAILKASVFASTNSETEPTTLVDYISRMKPEQDVIYYMTGESRTQIERSPHLEAFRAKGIEVLLLSDPVDEVWVSSGLDFEDKQLVSVAKGVVDLDGDDAESTDEDKTKQQEEFAPLLTWLGETLSDEVTEVRLSSRLTESAACLVGDAFSMTPQLEKLYRASGQPVPKSKRILELNPDNALVTALQGKFGSEGDRSALEPTAKLVYAAAVLAEGGDLDDPAEVAKLLAETLTQNLG